MHRRCFYSRLVIETRKRRLQRLEKNANSDISSSSEDGNEHIQDVQYSTLTTNNIFSVLDDDLSGYNEYHDDEDDSVDQSPPLYNGRRLSSMKSMKLLMDLLISDINLDKKNILCLLQLIKFILPQPKKKQQ